LVNKLDRLREEIEDRMGEEREGDLEQEQVDTLV